MTETRADRRKREKLQKKQKERSKNAKQIQPTNNDIATNAGNSNSAIILSNNKNGVTSITINSSKLVPPSKQYYPDSFTIEKYTGYSDLYFGQKRPGKRDGSLMSCLAIRFSNKLIKSLIINNHKDFYKGLFTQNPITDNHYTDFKIDLKNQYPEIIDNQHVSLSNFIYSTHGADMGQLMFYQISPAYVHHLVSGKPAIVQPDSNGVEGIMTVTMPVDLLAYFYHTITNKKNEY